MLRAISCREGHHLRSSAQRYLIYTGMLCASAGDTLLLMCDRIKDSDCLVFCSNGLDHLHKRQGPSEIRSQSTSDSTLDAHIRSDLRKKFNKFRIEASAVASKAGRKQAATKVLIEAGAFSGSCNRVIEVPAPSWNRKVRL